MSTRSIFSIISQKSFEDRGDHETDASHPKRPIIKVLSMGTSRVHFFLFGLLVTMGSLPALADVRMEFQGYLWYTPTSNEPGDLNIAMVADHMDPVFGIDLATSEVTFVISGATCSVQVPIGPNEVATYFVGGTLAVYVDPTMNHEFGVNPPNPVVPASFLDGTPLLIGEIGEVYMYENLEHHLGQIGIYFSMLEGLALEQVPSRYPALTFSMLLEELSPIPDGYKYLSDATFVWNVGVAVETTSFGRVKALFR